MRQFFLKRIFGIRCKQFRKKHNISQFDLAVLVGCTPSHISQLERGVLGDRKMRVIIAICDLMEISICEFFRNIEV